MSDFYQLSAPSLQGEAVDFQRYQGKVVLAVNTASRCGFTPQYKGLQQLHEKYAPYGLEILGFPCNQFGHQEPGDAASIRGGCLLNYGVDFQVFEKSDVKGPRANPVFAWLTARMPGWFGRTVKWNFTKFLIGRDGQPIRRFAPLTSPASMEGSIRRALGL